MFLIERLEYVDDVFYRNIRVWWWWCCWSKSQSAEDDVANRNIKVLKMMLLIERSKCWRWCCWLKRQSVEDVADRKVKVLKMLLLIEISKCWRCCCSKGQSVEDFAEGVADRKFKVLKMFPIKRSKDADVDQRVAVVEYWRWSLYDVEKLPMI